MEPLDLRYKIEIKPTDIHMCTCHLLEDGDKATSFSSDDYSIDSENDESLPIEERPASTQEQCTREPDTENKNGEVENNVTELVLVKERTSPLDLSGKKTHSDNDVVPGAFLQLSDKSNDVVTENEADTEMALDLTANSLGAVDSNKNNNGGSIQEIVHYKTTPLIDQPTSNDIVKEMNMTPSQTVEKSFIYVEPKDFQEDSDGMICKETPVVNSDQTEMHKLSEKSRMLSVQNRHGYHKLSNDPVIGDKSIALKQPISMLLDNRRFTHFRPRRTPIHIRKKLIEAAEDISQNYTSVADMYAINRSTAGSIVRRHRIRKWMLKNATKGKATGSRPKFSTDGGLLADNLKRYRHTNGSYSHDRYIEKSLKTKYGEKVLSTNGYQVQFEKNTGKNKQQLHYCEWFLQDGLNGHCVYISELEFRIQSKNNSESAEIHIIIAASQRIGLMHHKLQLRNISDNTRQEFLSTVASKLSPDDTNFFIFDKWSKSKLAYDSPMREKISMIFLPENSDFLSIFSPMILRLMCGVQESMLQPGTLDQIDSLETGLSVDEHFNLLLCKHLDEQIMQIKRMEFTSWFHDIVKHINS